MTTKTKQTAWNTRLRWIAVALTTLLLLILLVLALIPQQPSDTGGLRPNPYGAADFGYENGYLTCLTGESWLGIDVSHHQGEIDWQQVAGAGVKFAMIRLGNRTVKDGLLKEHRYGRANLVQAQNAGLKVGVYFYSQAVSVEEAQEEARYLLELLDGAALQMPVVFDWEVYSDTGRTANVDGETLNACAVAFCEIIRDAGYAPMVYFNKDISRRLLDLEQMQRMGYRFWFAHYTDQMTFPHWVDMWQYTESGQVPGIDTPVDLNLYLLSEGKSD